MRQFKLQRALRYHKAPITLLAISTSFSILVSGSSDRVLVLWDLNRLRFGRRLLNSAIEYDLTGSMSNVQLFFCVWGQLIMGRLN